VVSIECEKLSPPTVEIVSVPEPVDVAALSESRVPGVCSLNYPLKVRRYHEILVPVCPANPGFSQSHGERVKSIP
jgi:hypothetical protein